MSEDRGARSATGLYRVAKTHRMPYLRFPQKSPIVSVSLAENDLQHQASSQSSPPCRMSCLSSVIFHKRALQLVANLREVTL